ncbi:MAG: chorismate--pyruvate lyase [Oscillospiraceae bacterium]|nr:chorismate--pyruvate lyase [Oscillospiraceae bacterium]
MDERFYVVRRIDGDYAYLERTDVREDELLIVARALLPEETDEGTKLKWAFLTYEIIE